MFEPIKIDSAFSDKNYKIICTLVDRDDFIEDVEMLRQPHNLNLMQLFNRKKIDDYFKNQDKALAHMANKKTPISDIKPYKHGENEIVINGRRFEKNKYDFISRKLLKKYHKSLNLQDVISFAISCGEVLVKDLNRRYPIIKPDGLNQDLPSNIKEQPHALIIVNPETRQDDLLTAFNSYLKYSIRDTKSSIRDHRGWYWKVKNRKKDETIQSVYDTLRVKIEFKSFQKAISEYKKLLQKSIR